MPGLFLFLRAIIRILPSLCQPLTPLPVLRTLPIPRFFSGLWLQDKANFLYLRSLKIQAA